MLLTYTVWIMLKSPYRFSKCRIVIVLVVNVSFAVLPSDVDYEVVGSRV